MANKEVDQLPKVLPQKTEFSEMDSTDLMVINAFVEDAVIALPEEKLKQLNDALKSRSKQAPSLK